MTGRIIIYVTVYVEPSPNYAVYQVLFKQQQLKELAASSHHHQPGPSSGGTPVDAETQARLEALLEAAGIGKQLTEETKQPFSDPEVNKDT